MAQHGGKTKVLIDTDIGDDIDDAFALAFCLGSPEFDILGVTVVYGDVETRAKIARKLCQSWGRADIPVRMGFERPMAHDWFPGTAPEVPSQRRVVANEPPLEDAPRNAAEFIAETVRAHPGEVTILTLGAMTNVAAALRADPALASRIKAVHSQAGAIPPIPPTHFDWNICYDVAAAQAIARSGVLWTTIGAGVCGANAPGRSEFDALEASGLPSAALLLDLVVHMKRYKLGQDPSVRTIRDVRSASICDVMVPAALLWPEPMALQRGWMDVTDRGLPQPRLDPAGPHRWATRRLADGSFRGELLRRLLSAPSARQAAP